jgi:hypothetical protein
VVAQGISVRLPGPLSHRLPAASFFIPAAPLLFLVGFSLSMDRLPIPSSFIRSVAPAAAVLAIAMAPFALRKPRWTPISATVAVFFAYAVVHSAVLLGLDLLAMGEDLDRASEWLRQVAGLAVGVVIFFVLRTLFSRTSGVMIWKWVLIGAVPALVMAMVQVLTWEADSSTGGNINLFVRATLLKLYYMPNRVSGISVEPASYAGYAAIVVLPLAAMAAFITRRWMYSRLFLLLAAVSLIFTTGGIGAVNIGLICIGLVALTPGKWRKVALLTAVVFAISGAAVLYLRPNTYLRGVLDEHNDLRDRAGSETQSPSGSAGGAVVEFVSTGSGTVATKIGSTLDPVLHLASSRVSIGYGMGGTGFHADEVLYPETEAKFKANYDGRISLYSLAGRLLVETGLIGVLLFATMGAVAFWRATALMRDRAHSEAVPLFAARIALFVFAGSAFVSLASFVLPYIWLWLAVVDSREPALAETTESAGATATQERSVSGLARREPAPVATTG